MSLADEIAETFLARDWHGVDTMRRKYVVNQDPATGKWYCDEDTIADPNCSEAEKADAVRRLTARAFK